MGKWACWKSLWDISRGIKREALQRNLCEWRGQTCRSRRHTKRCWSCFFFDAREEELESDESEN